MNREEFDALEKRVAARAEELWRAAGSPDGPRQRFIDDARALIGMEENPKAGTVDPDAKPVVAEAALMYNLGEFPSFSDSQAEEPAFPDPANEKPSAK
jgi:Protein of unknown function (DUF2934)